MTCNKTPISLMNEVCKANNIVPEYKVVEESGPPHQKTFKVELTLLDQGCYEGVGSTIKAAKHKAAQLGLETSGLTKPERKPKQPNYAPSVELNSLAMKLGRVVEYCDIPSPVKQHVGPSPIPCNAYNQFRRHYQSYGAAVVPFRNNVIKMTVSVRVGDKEYIGEGFRKKEARRNAASKALADLYQELQLEPKHEISNMIQASDVKSEVRDSEVVTDDRETFKSDISMVYEIASKRKLKIDFEVVSSTGPPHHRNFVTKVTVGEFTASGEGPSKKVSKHLASSKILEQLKQLPPIKIPPTHPKRRLYNHGGYGKKSPKELDPSLNPISLLGQLRQKRKETLPEYSLISEEGIRNKEFTIQVQVDAHAAQGSGANKKEAKKNAAEAMLQLLGIRMVKSQASGDNKIEKNLKQSEDKNTIPEKQSATDGRQLPPGLLPILPEMATRNVVTTPCVAPLAKPLNHVQQVSPSVVATTVTVLNRAPGAPVVKPMSNEILQNGSSSAMQKLQQLAESGGFQVQYQDTTKDNKEQFLAVVTTSTVPPLICRGFGPTLEVAFEHAAANALATLLQASGAVNASVVDHLGENGPGK